ncbi:hypothetical protein F4818DRAFT_224941 [Hypoxylon cercidicola]|nr:hypothetical protein F4818DRAFT_224941 [Hypoxylon cercidicola]
MSGTCETGFIFYSCGNGFRGCCSEAACDLGGCPDDSTQPDPEPTSSTRKTDVVTLRPSTTTDVISETTIFDASSTQSGTVDSRSTVSTAEPTTDDPSTIIDTATPSLPSPSTPTDLASTPQSSNEADSSLSTASIAGICIGGTVLTMFILLIIYLRIRRYRIAKRHAASESARIHYSDAAFAEDFMKDHPSLSAMRHSRTDAEEIIKLAYGP